LKNGIFIFSSGDTILALNGLELTTNNVNAMLGAIPGSMEVNNKHQFCFNYCVVLQVS
jgi:hypothetical protein